MRSIEQIVTELENLHMNPCGCVHEVRDRAEVPVRAERNKVPLPYLSPLCDEEVRRKNILCAHREALKPYTLTPFVYELFCHGVLDNATTSVIASTVAHEIDDPLEQNDRDTREKIWELPKHPGTTVSEWMSSPLTRTIVSDSREQQKIIAGRIQEIANLLVEKCRLHLQK